MSFYPETTTNLYLSEPNHSDETPFRPFEQMISCSLPGELKDVDQENIQALHLIDQKKEEEDEYNSALTSTLSHSNSYSEDVNHDIEEFPAAVLIPNDNLNDD